MTEQKLIIGKHSFSSRVFVGTAAYPNYDVMFSALAESGTELVTISLRRVSPQANKETNLYAQLKEKGYVILPNTAGCLGAKEAIMTAQLSREALGTDLIKLEVIADETTLLPNGRALLIAAEALVKDGFTVLPYTNDDPILARQLEDIGCAAVMPLAAPIGTGLGIVNPHNLRMIVQQANVPVIVDAGLGTASDVSQAFEYGADAVLLNTAIARALDPVKMAKAVKLSAEAGRLAFASGRMPKKFHAESASSLSGKGIFT